MTSHERDAELGRLVRERADIRQTVACLRSKLLRAQTAFRAVAVALGDERTQRAIRKTEEGIVVPSLGRIDVTSEEAHVLPEGDDIMRWLSAKIEAEARLAEIESILPV